MANLTVPVSKDDHWQGDRNAYITLVEYGDYECPYCGKAHPIVKKLQEALGDELKVVFRNFPLTKIHPNAMRAAEAAEAAGLQGKFWEMHDLLFENQTDLSEESLAKYAEEIGIDVEKFKSDMVDENINSRVMSDFESGVESGVNGTPTFFINGERFNGVWTDYDAFLAALEDA